VLTHRPVTANRHYRTTRTLREIGEYALANGHYDAAIRLNPRNATYYNSKAWMLATAPDDAARNGSEAVAAATRAVQLEDEADYHDTLAAAYAEAGDFDRAIEEQEIAIEMYGAEPFNFYVRGARGRLELYRNGMSYRE
jgi:tetratricopeptide (TPR) repeat protein